MTLPSAGMARSEQADVEDKLGPSTKPVRLEITVDHPEALLAACRGGAERIELCSSLVDGGLTPSLGLMEWARAATDLPIHAMVRPRSGNFLYSASELAIMERDVRAMRAAGADGVVFGALTPDAHLDTVALRRLSTAARPMRVVLHRAFDLVADQAQAIEEAIVCGVDILLTSGGAPSLALGLPRITSLAHQAAGRIEIMGGAGVRLSNAARLWSNAPIDTLHASMRSVWKRARHHEALSGATMGARDAEELYTVREEDVRSLLAMLSPRPTPPQR